MSDNFPINISLFGGSHAPEIGAVVTGMPAGIKLDYDFIDRCMKRRAPGSSELTTSRKEADVPEFLSGITDGATDGTPLKIVIKNTNVKKSDYSVNFGVARPSHADYPAFVKYGKDYDMSGGGIFSARMTAPVVCIGAIAQTYLKDKGVTVGGHIASVGDIGDAPFDPVDVSAEQLELLRQKPFPVIDDAAGEKMKEVILSARSLGDSVGGVVECAAVGLPCGTGNPLYNSLESLISYRLFSVPALKGVEFGAGFSGTRMKGSEFNDSFYYDRNRTVRTRTNNNGGILGGLAVGMPLILRAAFKPTPSIALKQNTVDLINKTNCTIVVHGRHDPCVVTRAVPCVEANVAIALMQALAY